MGRSPPVPCAGRQSWCNDPTTSSWCGATPAKSRRALIAHLAYDSIVRSGNSHDNYCRPGRCQPCSPIRAKEVPAGDGWLHAVKFDGCRVRAHKVGSRVVIYSRNGHDFTERFPCIASCCTSCPLRRPCSMARLWPVMPMGVRTSPGCMCDGAGRALSACGQSTYLRSMAVISVCRHW